MKTILLLLAATALTVWVYFLSGRQATTEAMGAPPAFVVHDGKTNRFATLVEAMRAAPVGAVIYPAEGTHTIETNKILSDLTAELGEAEALDTFRRVSAAAKNARMTTERGVWPGATTNAGDLKRFPLFEEP